MDVTVSDGGWLLEMKVALSAERVSHTMLKTVVVEDLTDASIRSSLLLIFFMFLEHCSSMLVEITSIM